MTVRKIKALAVPGIEPGGADMALPKFEHVDPTGLLVDESYQRNLSERSVSLIRKIVADWDWRRFKPPVVVRLTDGLHVLDGQHTAIAAASHPKIKTIPVMVVDAPEIADRARAFLGHNRDRINVTSTQMFVAAVAAGDPDAVTVAQVCERAGIRILKNPPGAGFFKANDTMAVAAIGALVNRRGAMGARQLLDILSAAKLVPVAAVHIKAAEALMKDPEYAGQISDDDLTTVIIATRDTAEKEARVFAAAHNVPIWRALAIIWFKGRPRGRRRAA
jgi:hypothetical protein